MRCVWLALLLCTTARGDAVVQANRILAGIRATGKPAYAWSDNLGLKGLFLAGACDSVFMPPAADMSITGIQINSTHVRRTLEKLGIEPNIHKIKDYKSAAEVVTREDPVTVVFGLTESEVMGALSGALRGDPPKTHKLTVATLSANTS